MCLKKWMKEWRNEWTTSPGWTSRTQVPWVGRCGELRVSGGKYLTQLSRTFAIYIIGIISRAAQQRAAADNSQQSCGENRQNGNNSNRLWFDFLANLSLASRKKWREKEIIHLQSGVKCWPLCTESTFLADYVLDRAAWIRKFMHPSFVKFKIFWLMLQLLPRLSPLDQYSWYHGAFKWGTVWPCISMGIKQHNSKFQLSTTHYNNYNRNRCSCICASSYHFDSCQSHAVTHLARQNYDVCIRRSAAACYICYSSTITLAAGGTASENNQDSFGLR